MKISKSTSSYKDTSHYTGSEPKLLEGACGTILGAIGGLAIGIFMANRIVSNCQLNRGSGCMAVAPLAFVSFPIGALIVGGSIASMGSDILRHNRKSKIITVNYSVLQIKEKAIEYVEKLEHLREHSNAISAYIQKVLADPAFQKNPQRFMDKWREKRGLTCEFRIPEDPARNFFEQELHI